MNIQQILLTKNPYSRPGTRINTVKAVACHYVGNPKSTAINNRNYFNNLQYTKKTYASSHYIIGLEGEIIQCIPESEVSYCTNQANSYTISIEACHPDSSGKFTDVTYKVYVELCADICKRHGLNPLAGGLIRHYDVTKKCCPKWFVDYLPDWEKFKKDVLQEIQPKISQWVQEGTRWWYKHYDGSCTRNGWEKINGEWYRFNDDGWMQVGWIQEGLDWYYLDPANGRMMIGFICIDGKTYYMNEDGKMLASAMVFTPDTSGSLH